MKRLSYWSGAEGLARISQWVWAGLEEKQIAGRMCVSVLTLRRWAARQPELGALLEAYGKAYWDVRQAVYKHATGFTQIVTRQAKQRRVEYGPDGKKTLEEESYAPVEEEVYVPPSVNAALYWLNNCQPSGWSAQLTPEEMLPKAAEALLEKAYAQREEALREEAISAAAADVNQET